MQLRPTLSEVEARLECKADRKQTEHELSRRALWSDVDQAVAKTMPAETTQKLLDAKADRSEVEKVMEAHDRTMQQVGFARAQGEGGPIGGAATGVETRTATKMCGSACTMCAVRAGLG